jgi:hypothetical protein
MLWTSTNQKTLPIVRLKKGIITYKTTNGFPRIIKNIFQLFMKVEKDMLIRVKKAQDVVVWFLAFQKSLCLANKTHCCVTSLL